MRRFLRNSGAASAAEFALILPAALLLLFGVIDVGRYAWQLNEYEKAVQLGARYAVATDVVATPLNTVDFSTITCPGAAGTLTAGDTICKEALDTLVCDDAACACPSGGSGICAAASGADYNGTAFDNIVARMRVASPRISDTSVEVVYTASGIGYFGDPAQDSSCTQAEKDAFATKCALPDVAPLVTVRLTNMTYRPITLSLIGFDVRYPTFSYSLTLEDGDGAIAS